MQMQNNESNLTDKETNYVNKIANNQELLDLYDNFTVDIKELAEERKIIYFPEEIDVIKTEISKGLIKNETYYGNTIDYTNAFIGVVIEDQNVPDDLDDDIPEEERMSFVPQMTIPTIRPIKYMFNLNEIDKIKSDFRLDVDSDNMGENVYVTLVKNGSQKDRLDREILQAFKAWEKHLEIEKQNDGEKNNES